ncbi:hypothetical protein EIP91_001512 [Steccherinum ochraceum]|uniref:Ribosomal protein L22 n=1 Tax=Steccherinum ochraceum TaxID=92696 RepID=A0A4R0RUH2_9APHY|nr:hypothetical protein EIP91_001512 [Steccherinum ochraceum]
MAPKQPELGSLAIQAPTLASQTVHVTPSTCYELSVFKDLMKEYRKLDDTITMRYNRTTAQFRDRDRLGLGGKGNVQDQACAHLWKELVENWKRRRDIIEYCVEVVDVSLDDKRTVLASDDTDPATQRKVKGALYAEETQRRLMHNEFTVESIVRNRSLNAQLFVAAVYASLLPQTPFRAPIEGEVKVPIVLGVMSQCPDAILCESVFDSVVEEVGDKIDLTLTFIGQANSSEPEFGITCKHGPGECAGNVHELCAIKYEPFSKWWNFVQCENKLSRPEIGTPEAAFDCAATAGIDWTGGQVGVCAGPDGSATGKEGIQLLKESVEVTASLGITRSLSPTVRKDTPEDIAAARKAEAEKGQSSVFDSLIPVEDKEEVAERAIEKAKSEHTHHKYSTANFKISHRKLNKLGRQIAGQPIDMAIMQMNFSEKRASKRIKSMLVVAKDHAVGYKGLDVSKLVVGKSIVCLWLVREAWVTKGPNVLKRLEPKGRGRFGIRHHPDSRMSVVLKEGKTKAELAQKERARKLKRIVSSGITREDVPLRNPGPAWAW